MDLTTQPLMPRAGTWDEPVPVERVLSVDILSREEPHVLTEHERRLMQLFPRQGFHVHMLNLLQWAELHRLVSWGWFVELQGGWYVPTAYYLECVRLTMEAQTA